MRIAYTPMRWGNVLLLWKGALMFKLIVGVLLISGWGLAAAAMHVVRTPSGVTVVTKDTLGFTDTYADTREWKSADLSEHKLLVNRLLSTEHGDALEHISGVHRSARTSAKSTADRLLDLARGN